VSQLREFDLTPCFEEGVLLSSVLSILFIASIIRCLSLSSAKCNERSSRSIWALRFKIFFLLAAVLTSLTNLVLVLVQHRRVPVLPSYVSEVIAFATTVPLTFYNHHRTRAASTILLLFWPVYTLVLAIWIRTIVSEHSDFSSVLILRCSATLLGLVAYAIECAGPEIGQAIRLDDAQTIREHPSLTANIYSLWSFSWMTPLMKKGAKQFVTEADLPSLPPKEESSNLGQNLGAALKKHSLWKALFLSFGRSYAVAAGLKVIQDCLAFSQPQLLRMLLAYISRYQNARYGLLPPDEPRPSPFEGAFIIVIMFIASVLQTITLHQYFQRCFETGMRVRASLATTIYAKALVISNDREQSSGDIVNLMSVDSTRLQDFCTYGLIAISGPLQIILAFISLYHLLGWSAFVGVAIMVFSVPAQTLIARYLKRMQEAQMKSRDQRTRTMSEILANIKSIKLYGWELAFIQRVLSIRNDQELVMMKKIGVVTALNMTLWGGIPLLVAFASFATAATVTNTPLTSDIIFPSISLFMLLSFPLAMFSQVTSNIVEAIVSIDRLNKFFRTEELQSDARLISEKPNLKPGDEVLSIRNGEFSWSRNSSTPNLEDINVTLKKGQLLGVLGRVGSGKTSLLSAMIGDMHKSDGQVIISGNVAYAPQNPWILSASVRDNILFSHEYEEDFYNVVLDACALRHDLSLLPEGDLTEVGEKGITLSGGQRARIALARAVYARADIILLDDVLAAVDSHVARHLFDHVIGPQGILATKARVLVTNSVAFLRQFDELVFMRRGIILEAGSYRSLLDNSESEVHKLIHGHGTGGSGTSTPFVKSASGSATPNNELSHSDIIETGNATPHNFGDEKLAITLRRGSFRKALLVRPSAGDTQNQGLSKEHSEQGRVKRDVYTRYIAAASKIGFILYLLAIAAQQVFSVLSTFALRNWGEHNQQSGGNTDMWKYLAYYGFASLASTASGGTAGVILWVQCGIRSAQLLHEQMLKAVMAAPLTFFELTPSGRVLNLFSRDTYVVDQVLIRVLGSFFRTFAVCLSIIVVIGSSFPAFLIALIPLGWFYFRVMTYYLATSRELKRLDAVSRSPIFAWFAESLSGLSSIRAYSQQTVFQAKIEQRVDRNQICYLPSISVNRWLAIRLEFVGALVILIASSLAMVALVTSGVDAGLVGLVLSYALNTTSSLNWFVRSASEVEQNIVSVERILHYVELEPEAPAEIPDNKPSDTWPVAGEVEFRHYTTRYRPELDPVLKDVSFTIRPKEKIGICGRTGAGKSSLLLALFRIIEAVDGAIVIDGIDISKIGLRDLRSAITIVPQSPDLFEGTLRENVDPIGEYTDAQIWDALGQTYLKDYVENQTEGRGLDTPVREGGLSLSAGQRQLLCFARALLRKSKILVLDEATSAVDMDTDRDIQAIITGPEFANVTMFTIAHRLNTIIDSDRVMVLDSGKVVELAPPKELLAKPESVFYSLASEAGLVNLSS
jgi:ATP-binding cassette subfamily C (CFTR/MRP) protein 1